MELTQDAFLGDKIMVHQPKSGFRAGIDSVMLAASVPAQPGDLVFEAGVGPGVAAMCLLARTQNTTVMGLEINPDMVDLARVNAVRNDLAHRFSVDQGDVLSPPAAIKETLFDHVMLNPPFTKEGAGQVSPDPAKAKAHMEHGATLADWLALGAARTKGGGSLTIIHKAERLADILAGMHGPFGDIVVFPLWARQGEEARRVIVQGKKQSKAPLTMAAGLVLHGETTTFTDEAAAILRHAAPLTLRG